MSSTWGEKIKISLFGESHGACIGVVIDGFPAGFPVNMDNISVQMKRRAPGRDSTATPRREPDTPEIISGILNNKTTGAPICAIIKNTNTKSRDYKEFMQTPRPGHSDYTAFIKYEGHNDITGGGHFSGRLTAPVVFAGTLCRQYLAQRGIQIAAHILNIKAAADKSFSYTELTSSLIERLSNSSFSVIDAGAQSSMRAEIEMAKMNSDSVGGSIECAVLGIPAGIGGPLFGGIESALSSILFGIPSVKGVEFGLGFKLAEMYGSESNDSFVFENGQIKTKTNHSGGILGGISTGMPVVFKVAVKPTPSIAKIQETVDLINKTNTKLEIHGRHDPCIVPRAVPVVEAATAIAVMNMIF